jgi:hypothetical protein
MHGGRSDSCAVAVPEMEDRTLASSTTGDAGGAKVSRSGPIGISGGHNFRQSGQDGGGSRASRDRTSRGIEISGAPKGKGAGSVRSASLFGGDPSGRLSTGPGPRSGSNRNDNRRRNGSGDRRNSPSPPPPPPARARARPGAGARGASTSAASANAGEQVGRARGAGMRQQGEQVAEWDSLT